MKREKNKRRKKVKKKIDVMWLKKNRDKNKKNEMKEKMNEWV